MTSPKTKRQPPPRDFDKYFATFQNDPFAESIGLQGVHPNAWTQFGPLSSGSTGYTVFTQEPKSNEIYSLGGNSAITPIGFDFSINGTTYKNFIASPHGWVALLDPSSSFGSNNLDKIYEGRFIANGSASYNNAAITQSFGNNDLFLAPWFDRLLMSHRDLDSFITFYSGTVSNVVNQKDNLLYGRSSGNYPYDEFDYGMRYALVNDSVNGKSLVIRWTSLGYYYRDKKLSFEVALHENGNIQFNYAPLKDYSTEFTTLASISTPVNVWRLDDTTTSVADATGNQPLTHESLVVRSVDGQINTAAFYSGSSNIVTSRAEPFADFANYDVTGSFSFSAWMKPASGSAGGSSIRTLISRVDNDGSKRGYALILSGGHLALKLTQNITGNYLNAVTTTRGFDDGNWHHVVVTYDGAISSSSIKLYVDGQNKTFNVEASNAVNNMQGSTGRFMLGGIGTNSSNAWHFSGTLDDVARWNTILSDSEITTIYNQGLGEISVFDITSAGFFSGSKLTTATCGIFSSGSSTWNYRDFSTLLGGTKTSRLLSDFGGTTYTPSFSDTNVESTITASYGISLNINNWPKRGGRITFSAPKIRRQLNRADVANRGRNQFFTETSFDDRRTLNYVTQSIIDPATLLPLGVLVDSTYPGVNLKQNLFSSGGIRIPNRTVLSAVNDPYLDDETENLQKVAPFTEDNLHEQGKFDAFFTTGSISSFGERKDSFSRGLSNKQSIRLSFPVNKKIKMLPSASSIYYFSTTGKQWIIPVATSTDHVTASFVKFAAKTLDVGGTVSGSVYLEDKIGFDAYGNAVGSGSLNIFRQSIGNIKNQSEPEIGFAFNLNDLTDLLLRNMPKSITRNSGYEASDTETFTLPITEPFLLEKAVVELPFCMGDSWFRDKTTFLICSSSNFAHTGSGGSASTLPNTQFFDEGGPAVTVTLLHQKNYGTGSVRDIVFRSTFTHQDDVNGLPEFVNLRSGTLSQQWNAILVGNKDNPNIISDPVAYTTVGASKVFTGSVFVKSDVAVTNCVHVVNFKSFDTSTYSNSTSLASSFGDFLNTEYIPLNDSLSASVLVGIDPFGRSMNGFIAGSEFVTTQNALFGTQIKNPFYLTGSADRQNVTSSLATRLASQGMGSYLYSIAKVALGKPKQSPYIVYPGDKLILAASKTRPALKSADIRINAASETTGTSNFVSSSYYSNISSSGHDITFNTGTINITLYGSYVKERTGVIQ